MISKKRAPKTHDSTAAKQRMRLEFLEAVMVWRGSIGRPDLVKVFGISLAQASQDFAKFRAAHSKTVKRWPIDGVFAIVGSPAFRPRLIEDGALGESVRLASQALGTLPIEWSAPAIRRASPKIENILAQSILTQRSARIFYTSVSSGKADWRLISPVQFVSDGHRWHVRAFCHASTWFKDFVIGRISDAQLDDKTRITKADDMEWKSWVTLVIRPKRGLSKARVRALEMDHGMKKGRLVLKIRKPLVFYTMNQYCLLPGSNSPMLELVSPAPKSKAYRNLVGDAQEITG